ncbi:MAG TPA: alginate lyase family protein [Chitinophagaceae bacterium]|nr:alginate lyase family protein [Chitinophagaceae bacterium]
MSIKRTLLISLAMMIIGEISGQVPKVLIMDANRLAEVKKKWQQQDETVMRLTDSLQQQAGRYLKMKPVSVMDKQLTPVSGNKHDYMSQAPYFWYDSTKPNGLPYKRMDGVRNPEIYKITDRTYLGNLETATRTLSLAWYITGDEKYAAKSSELLRTWFLDENTKMNPHLEYGQAVPGINTGRGIGLIETVALTSIADAAILLQGSKSWTEADHSSLQEWYSQFLSWMLTSKNGKDEHAAKNNHGTWYYAQVIDYSLFTGDKDKAKQLAEESKKRLDSQLTKEGKQPLELDRTNGLGYSTMNLRGWFTVATLADKTGVDLWSYQTPKSADLRTAFDWLLPYALGEKKWEYQQINNYNKNDIYPLLLQASSAFKDQKYLTLAKALNPEKVNVMAELLYGK